MIKEIRILLGLLPLLLVGSLSAQMGRADKMYAKGEYVNAIPLYKREAKGKSITKKQEALVKLGNCYKALNEYDAAEDAYAKAVDLAGDLPAIVYFDYAQILKINNKYEQAAEQYGQYLKMSPGDEYAKKALKFCMEIKYYLSKPMEYAVTNVGVVNTAKSEYAPYVTNGKLMFIAERDKFDFSNGYERNESTGQPFQHLFVSALNGTDVKKEKPYSKSVNGDYHDGPGCIGVDSTLYFTRIDYVNKRGAMNSAKIYTAAGNIKSPKGVKPLELNNSEYSIAHPSISSDNQTLFFTSNMPGGFGGKDIWMCKRSPEGWSKPVNLGPDVNTTGDEMFPSVRKDGTLFFSSNGLPGFGGLDIYSAKENQGKWIVERNEGMNLNSNADDFGITFLNDSTGYFSSNRVGGKGGDDIYLYHYKAKNMLTVSGNVLLTENINDKAVGKKVLLMDDKGKAIDSTYTNKAGYFEFRNLDPDKKYMTSIEESDPLLVNKARFFLADNDSTIHRVSTKYEGNRFVFKNLPVDPNALPEIATEDDLVFAGSLLHSGKTPVKNVKLKLVNQFGDVMEETTTNENGSFAFRNIPSDQNYIVSIEENDISLPEGTKITLNNKVGKEIRSFYKSGEKFTFQILSSDKATLQDMDAEDANLVMGLYGFMFDQNKNPLVNIRLKVKDENGQNEQEWITTENGKFSFKNLPADKDYIFEADPNDPALKGVQKIYIADSKGRIYKVVDLSSGKFEFRLLEADKTQLGEFVVYDPWLKVGELKKPVKPKAKTKEEEAEEESELSITIVENIYYPYGEWEIDDDGKAVLDKAVEAMKDYPKLVMEISSHTDSQSSADFNMTLSKKRAARAVEYIVSKGIDKSRLKSKGYGESKLLNRCGDGVECSDAEHKVNRRTEFKITKPVK